ncbi:Liver carboxylesterase [Myotis brandtii]|uniref:Carboxylic ester hydrolase n=1 Tax=Myotis brandtii TaxID=109478 RepID=S7Q9W9_MYOBR|nr:Liver carboxylesterase [Myotis brandtii]
MDTVMSSSQSPPFLSSVVDGVLLPKMPEELLAEKQLNSVPYIVGINQQEFGWMIPMGQVLGEYVSLEGFAQPVAVFLGVPFAKPPLGPLRFAPPQPAEPWTFVKNATSYPPMCSQDAPSDQVLSRLFTKRKAKIPLKFSEDCLYLNIYTPAHLKKKSRLPVMVWIHGGGLVVGGASTYDGLALSAHENVVVVIIQYRLGIWGFFSTGDEHSRGNWGHLDQLAALRWVQENIANFGGDAGSVTIFGASAGAESVSVLVLSPLAKNLFHRAISESGVSFTTGLVKKDIKATAQQIATFAGCQTTTSAVMVHCLRQKSEEELMETSLKMSPPFLSSVVDGVLLPKMPEELLAEKQLNSVPYIVGINQQEFGWILPMMMGYPISEGKLDQKTASSLLWQSYPVTNIPEALIPAVIEKYLGGTDDPVKKKDWFLELLADVVFGVPSVTVARGHRGESQRLDRKGHQPHPLRCLSCPPLSIDRPPRLVPCGQGCSQDAMSAQVLSELFSFRKENIPLKFSEDCLYLNIYTPADLSRKSRLPRPSDGQPEGGALLPICDLCGCFLPVMVWIHGGGLVVGGASSTYGLALSAHENVVVVIIQYRLGIWGFFSTGDEHSRGNWGHLDQLAALRWVQENIANFGGDPGSVTIFGESAGGASVSVLVSVPGPDEASDGLPGRSADHY